MWWHLDFTDLRLRFEYFIAIVAMIGVLINLLTNSYDIGFVRRHENLIRTILIIFAGSVLAGGADIVSGLIAQTPQYAAETISNPYFTPLWFLLGLGFFWVRGYKPIWYGAAEIFIGTTAIFYAIRSDVSNLPPKLLALSTGIYIIVRGLDNIEKGLTPSYKERRWNKFFRKARPA